MKRAVYSSVIFLSVMILITGILYPLLITGIATIVFPHKAAGSLVTSKGKYIGSELIGQSFSSNSYFWPRPSATNYNPLPSSGSNLGLLNPLLEKQVHDRDSVFRKMNLLSPGVVIPAGMLTASGSGLDPDISPAEAYLQLDRIAASRGFDASKREKVLELIRDLTDHPHFLIFGEARINVFLLNLNLDSIK